MKPVIDKNTPISRASKMHCVLKSTLHDCISGNVLHGDKPGPDPLWSPAEEEKLSNFLIELAQAGYGKTRKEVRHIAGRVAVHKNKKDTSCITWVVSKVHAKASTFVILEE